MDFFSNFPFSETTQFLWSIWCFHPSARSTDSSFLISSAFFLPLLKAVLLFYSLFALSCTVLLLLYSCHGQKFHQTTKFIRPISWLKTSDTPHTEKIKCQACKLARETVYNLFPTFLSYEIPSMQSLVLLKLLGKLVNSPSLTMCVCTIPSIPTPMLTPQDLPSSPLS